MKKEKLRHYSNVIASHADAHWVTPLWFGLFLVDSWLLFIPVDSLMAATLTVRPQHTKKWIVFSVIGFAIGLALAAILVNSHLQPYLFHYFEKWGYLQHVNEIIKHAETYGYWELALGVFTIVPSLVGVLLGVVLGLNPWLVWGISLGGKVVKIIFTVWVIFSTSHLVKKALGWYVKTSV